MTIRKKPVSPPRRQLPAFSPVPLRTRRDGWTPRRQAAFLGHLAETGSVTQAARRVNMARETAYRLREKRGAESFAHAWDVALGRARPVRRPVWKVTGEELRIRAFSGRLKPLMYRGRFTGTLRKTDNAALLRVVANPGAITVPGGGVGAGWSHDPWVAMCQPEEPLWWPREERQDQPESRGGGRPAGG